MLTRSASKRISEKTKKLSFIVSSDININVFVRFAASNGVHCSEIVNSSQNLYSDMKVFNISFNANNSVKFFEQYINFLRKTGVIKHITYNYTDCRHFSKYNFPPHLTNPAQRVCSLQPPLPITKMFTFNLNTTVNDINFSLCVLHVVNNKVVDAVMREKSICENDEKNFLQLINKNRFVYNFDNLFFTKNDNTDLSLIYQIVTNFGLSEDQDNELSFLARKFISDTLKVDVNCTKLIAEIRNNWKHVTVMKEIEEIISNDNIKKLILN